jgi:hypothetical protein
VQADVASTITPNQAQMKNQLEAARLPLREILASHPDGITPTDLMRSSRYSSREVDAFYEELYSLYATAEVEQVERQDEFEPLLRINSSVYNLKNKAKDTPDAH